VVHHPSRPPPSGAPGGWEQGGGREQGCAGGRRPPALHARLAGRQAGSPVLGLKPRCSRPRPAAVGAPHPHPHTHAHAHTHTHTPPRTNPLGALGTRGGRGLAGSARGWAARVEEVADLAHREAGWQHTGRRSQLACVEVLTPVELLRGWQPRPLFLCAPCPGRARLASPPVCMGSLDAWILAAGGGPACRPHPTKSPPFPPGPR